MFELEYFKKNGKHLDVDNITLCTGSRCSGGNVPGVGWGDARLSVAAAAAVSVPTAACGPVQQLILDTLNFNT